MTEANTIEFGDCRTIMRRWASEGVKVQTCVTSPPYFGLRDYGVEGQLGLEETPEQYIAAMVEVFRCVRDVLADDGTLWVNIGDSYANDTKWGGKTGGKHAKGLAGETGIGRNRRLTGLAGKNLIGIPWLLAFALRADGWILRQDIIWQKPNPLPESVTDRCTKSHEYIFLLSKSPRYYFDSDAIKEPANLTGKGNANGFRGGAYVNGSTFDNSSGGKRTSVGNVANSFARKTATTPPPGTPTQHRPDRDPVEYSETRNKRSVWTVATKPYKGAHFATFPPALIEPCILAGSRANDLVLDPFMGSGTTAEVAQALGRGYLGCELNPDYKALQIERLRQSSLFAVAV